MNGDVSQGGDGIISGALVEENIIYDNGVGGGSGINCDGVQNSRHPEQPALQQPRQRHLALPHRRRRRLAATTSSSTTPSCSRRRRPLGAQHPERQHRQHRPQQHPLQHCTPSAAASTSPPTACPASCSDYNVVMDRFTTDGGNTRLTLAQWRAPPGRTCTRSSPRRRALRQCRRQRLPPAAPPPRRAMRARCSPP